MDFLKNKGVLFYTLSVLSLVGYYSIAYEINRWQTMPLLLTFGLLFGLFVVMMRWATLKHIFIFGIVCRLLLFWELPALSQDFYRFIWDGNLQLLGINPYLYTPNTLIDIIQFPLSRELYEGMGGLSASHYSNYPPLSQWMYRLAAYANTGKIQHLVVVLKAFALGGEIIAFFFGKALLKFLKLPVHWIGWYFLNPLVVVEISGNVHGEGLMVGFLLAGLYALFKKQTVLGALLLAISIGVKLLPLLLLPVFFRFLTRKTYLFFTSLIIIFSFLIWFPFWENQADQNYFETIRLWFNTFEFNGSLYYIIREIGYEIEGYNIIRKLGKVTPYLVMAIVLAFTFLRRNRTPEDLLKSMLLVLSVYFFMATTVHPWYLVTLVALGSLTGYAFPLVWSATVLFSYSAYGLDTVAEQPVWIFLEYVLMYACFAYEMVKGPLLHHFQKIHFRSA